MAGWIKDAREFLQFAEELREFIMVIGRCLRDQKEERAEMLLRERIREQAAGRAAHEASRMAGPRK